MSFFGSLAALLASFTSIFGKIFEWFKNREAVEHGKTLKEIELIKKNDEVQKEQTKILLEDRTKEELIDKMKKGTF